MIFLKKGRICQDCSLAQVTGHININSNVIQNRLDNFIGTNDEMMDSF